PVADSREAYSPVNQRIVTASSDHTAQEINHANGQLVAKLEGHSDAVSSAAFSPDGQRVVTASGDHTARVWNAANGQLVAKLGGHSDAVWHAAFSPDGERIVDRKSTRLNSSHLVISYAVFCLKKKKQ